MVRISLKQGFVDPSSHSKLLFPFCHYVNNLTSSLAHVIIHVATRGLWTETFVVFWALAEIIDAVVLLGRAASKYYMVHVVEKYNKAYCMFVVWIETTV